MPRLIIGIAGRKSSGKSLATKLLETQFEGAQRTAFADPLKWMLRTLDLSNDQLWGSTKEVPDHEVLLGKTPRWAMQSLGTEWGRHCIHPDLWVEAWGRMVDRTAADVVLIEDVRFDNEVRKIREKGGIVIALERGNPHWWLTFKESVGLIHPSESFSGLVKRNAIPVVKNEGTQIDLIYSILLTLKDHGY